MDIKLIIFYAFVGALVVYAFKVNKKEIDKEGRICAYYRGFRILAPFSIIVYTLIMYDLLFVNCASSINEKIVAGAFFTLIFIAPLPYYVTRKLIINGMDIIGYSIFTGIKTISIDNISSVNKSKLGGNVVSDGNNNILIEKMMSGEEHLLKYIVNNYSNKSSNLTGAEAAPPS